MAEDGSEEIMFLCKWPVPCPSWACLGLACCHRTQMGPTLSIWAKPCPLFVLFHRKAVSFKIEMISLALRDLVYFALYAARAWSSHDHPENFQQGAHCGGGP
jgi:hypothetical protein